MDARKKLKKLDDLFTELCEYTGKLEEAAESWSHYREEPYESEKVAVLINLCEEIHGKIYNILTETEWYGEILEQVEVRKVYESIGIPSEDC